MTSLRISVIIPTLNGAEVLSQLLAEIDRQRVPVSEILVVDSSSDDGSAQRARQLGAKVITIARADFDHGATRSMAAREAKGEYILFFTQDALPTGPDLIGDLLGPLLKDPTIALSYGRQLPKPGASLAATALRAFNYPERSTVHGFSERARLGLKTVFVSNSCAAYRSSALKEVDYFPKDLIFGEDTCTAGRLLQKGYKIAYVAEAAVWHSHNYSLAEELRRSFDIGVLHSSEPWLLTTYGRAEGEGLRYIRSELAMIMEQGKIGLLPLFFFRNLTKFIGYKLGSKYDALPQWLVPRLSMNRRWWYRDRKP